MAAHFISWKSVMQPEPDFAALKKTNLNIGGILENSNLRYLAGESPLPAVPRHGTHFIAAAPATSLPPALSRTGPAVASLSSSSGSPGLSDRKF